MTVETLPVAKEDASTRGTLTAVGTKPEALTVTKVFSRTQGGSTCSAARERSAAPRAECGVSPVAFRSTLAYPRRMSGSREITQREFRNDSAAIMRGVERGESFTITRNGTPIARLIPLRRRTIVPRAEVLAAFATAPVVNADRLRADLDSISETNPFDREW